MRYLTQLVRSRTVSTMCFVLASMRLFACLPSTAFSIEHQTAQRPNIVLFLADDLGLCDIGCYGATTIRTPNIDRLASEGVRCTQFYANGPECSPTRTALITGRYQQRVGGLECAIGIGGVGRYDDAIRLAGIGQLGLPASETSIARLLQDSGYSTAIFGKWHLGYESQFQPAVHGFEHSYYCAGGAMDFFHHTEDPPKNTRVLFLNGQLKPETGYFTQLIADHAIEWLHGHASQSTSKPLFLYVPFTAPHTPYQGPHDFSVKPLDADNPRWKQGRAEPAVYAAMIESMDQAIGRIQTKLDEVGATQNTVVIFCSDNGGTGSALAYNLRGGKGQTFEGGIRSPCLVKWPAHIQAASTCNFPAVTFDLTRSIARIGQVAAPAQPWDGIDILKYVEHNESPAPRDLFWRQRRGAVTWRAVRESNLKYVSKTTASTVEEHLFDLTADPLETTSLAATLATDLHRLKSKLATWEVAVKPVR